MKTSQVYLIHFERPISPHHTTQHYTGSTDNLPQRLAEHRAGTGSRLCQVAKERGIGFVLVATWPGDRKVERQIKNRHNGKRLCPICNGALDFTLDQLQALEF